MKRTHGYWGEPPEPPRPAGGGGLFRGASPPPPRATTQDYDHQQQPLQHQQYDGGYYYDGGGNEDDDDLRLGADAGLNAFDVGDGDGDGGGGFFQDDDDWSGGAGGGFGGSEQQALPPLLPPPPPPARRAPPAAWAVQAVREAAAAAAGMTGGPALSSFAAGAFGGAGGGGSGWPAAAAAAPQPQPPPARPPPPMQPQQQHPPQNPPPPRPACLPTRFLAVCYGVGGGAASHHHQQQLPAAAATATVGLAFFDAATRELGLLQRQDERRGPAAFEVLDEAVMRLRPHVLCLSAKSGADVVAACRRALAQAQAQAQGQQQRQQQQGRPAAAAAAADEDDDEGGAPDPQSAATTTGGEEEGHAAAAAAAPALVYERAALFGYDQALSALRSALRQQQQQQQRQQRRQRPRAPLSSPPSFSGGNGNDGNDDGPDLSPAAALQVCAGGALVALLRRERLLAPDNDDNEDEDEDDEDGAPLARTTTQAQAPPPPPQLLRCAPLALPARVDVAPDALRLLGVFRAAFHPSRMGIGSARRESRGSLFAQLSARCRTQSGRRLMRHWLSRPLADLATIAARQDAIEALLRAPREPWRALERALAPAQDLAALVARLRLAQGRPDPAAYRQLLAALAALRELRDAAAVLLLGGGGEAGDGGQAAAASAAAAESSVAGGGQGPSSPPPPPPPAPPPLARLPAASRLHAAVDDAAFAECARLVEDTLEVGAGPAAAVAGGGAGSAAAAALVEGGTLVRPGVCPQLDRLRAAYHALPDALTAAVDAELVRVPPSAAMAHAAVVAPPQPSSVSSPPHSSLYGGGDGGASAATGNDSAHPPPPPAPAVSRIRFSILYLPQVGFVLAVGGGRLGPSMLAALPDYEYAFSNSETGATFTAFYCCDATRALNRRWGDLMWRIQDLEAAISAALTRRVLDGGGGGGGGGGRRQARAGVGAALLAAAPAVAELDCLSALAAAARDHGWARPTVTPGTRLDVRGGRDPLVEARRLRLEGSVAGVVPNDACIGSDDDDDDDEEEGEEEEGGARREDVGGGASGSARASARVLVVMGPNASGKSVFVRQAALVALLAHVGSFVPAQSATVGLADRLIVVAAGAGGDGGGGGGGSGNDQLAGRRPSSFQADLLRLGAAMRAVTRRSIVLLDEFGSGTLSCDGAGLLAAALEAWAAPGRSGGLASGGGGGGGRGRAGLPRVLACTHFTELLDPRVLDPRRAPRLRFLSMGVVVRGGGEEGGEGEGGGGGGGGGARGGGGGGHRRRPQQPVFLYRAEPNPTRAAPVFGVECARLAGVPPCVTSRAAVVLAAMTGAAAAGVARAGEGAPASAAAASSPPHLPRLLPRGVAPLLMPGAAEDDALAQRLVERLGRVRLEQGDEDEEGREGEAARGTGAGATAAAAAAAAPRSSLHSLLVDALGYELGEDVAAELSAMSA